MDKYTLDISTELMYWALTETNKFKADKLYKLAKKYEILKNEK